MEFADTQAEAMLREAVMQTIAPIIPMEREYSGEQMQKMILDYCHRAAKRKASNKPWQEVACDFAYSFFESLFKVFGESTWLDQVDFSFVVGAAFRTYLSRPELAFVSDEEFNQVFVKETAMGLDCSRYYSWSAYILKRVVTGKVSQKKVRDAVDNCREELLKQGIETAEQFVTAWIQGSISALGGDVPNVLPQPLAQRLFEAYVKEGGGIPLWLMNAPTDSVLNEVRSTVTIVYSGIPGAQGPPQHMGGGLMGKGMGMPSAFATPVAGFNPLGVAGYGPANAFPMGLQLGGSLGGMGYSPY